MIEVMLMHGARPEDLGLIPYWLNANDERPAKEQIHENYGHGGGWRKFEGFKMLPGRKLKYPGDPVMQPIAMIHLRDEWILFYPHSWIAIVQPDDSFEVARID